MEEAQLKRGLVSSLLPYHRVVRSDDNVIFHVNYIDYMTRFTGAELKPRSDVGEAVWAEKKRIPETWEELHDDTKQPLQLANMSNEPQPIRGKGVIIES